MTTRRIRRPAQKIDQYDRYRSDHETFADGFANGGPAWLEEIRNRGISSFNELGFPTALRGNEKWRFTNVGPIAKAAFEYPFDPPNKLDLETVRSSGPWDDEWARLVFVDGHYSAGLSAVPPTQLGLQVVDLASAVRSNGGLVDANLGRLAPADDNGFTAVNAAFLKDGAFVTVPEDSDPGSVVHLVFLTTERPSPIVSYPRTLVVVGRSSKLTLVESYIGLTQGQYFTDAVVEMVVEDGAEVEHYRYMSESDDAFHIGSTRVQLGRDSSFNSVSFATGARLARNDINVLLDAPGASCTMSGLYFTSGSQHIDNHINIDHAKPHTSSDLFFKGILSDRSKAVFSGRVLIRKDAQKSFARQADKNLLLSEGARVNTKPSLEIFADDVMAAHGATAGAVAEDALFYMRSRGIDEETARELLVYGFASEVIDRVRLEPLRAYLVGLFAGGLPKLEKVA